MTLLERVQRALAPDYEVLREVAGGGMGLVFTARHLRLKRVVAIKILRPDHATAVATERFLDEGQLLARLSHPGIVPIYDAGEADGLLYYVMEFVEGETLAERLKRGPLLPAEASSLAHDLLAALGAAHAQGVVHRDVKPANIFLRDGRALLGDFGIARWREESDPGLTTPGQRIGTPRYMSPEQRDGELSTLRTDVYAAGLVLWEACTGERWPAYQPPERADWSRIPAPLVPAIRKALALDPAERWADAREFAGAVKRPRRRRRTPWIVAGLVAAATAAYFLWPHPQPRGGIVLEIAPFVVRGANARAALGDSISGYLAEALTGNPDFRVIQARGKNRTPGAVRLTGTVTDSAGNNRLELLASGSGPDISTHDESASPVDWQALVDRLADTLVQRIWRGELEEADKWLPMAALPHASGLSRWHAAERLYAQGRWEDADSAYRSALRADSTCLLCSYRLLDIARWLSGPADTSRLARIVAHVDSFPPHYRALITAQRVGWPARYDSLKAAAKAWPEFFLASFLLGDELFHRGPLYGRLRQEAVEPMTHAVKLRPDFAPGNEHLAWLLLSEGGKAETRRALDSVPPEKAQAGLSTVIRVMLNIGYEWRFGFPGNAEAITRDALGRSGVTRDPRTPAGGRMMMTLDAPTGAVGLGRALEALGNSEAERNGLLAQAHGFAALGRLDSLRTIGTRLGLKLSNRTLPLYVLELEAALILADPDRLVRSDSALRKALGRYASPGAEAPALHRRAAWMLALLAAREGDDLAGARFRPLLEHDTAAVTLRGLVELRDALTRRDTARAGRALAALRSPDLTRIDSDPFEDAMLRLMQAELFSARDSLELARGTLRWHEHLQLVDFPVGDPQPGEVAWALGTLVRWRRARLLDRLLDEAGQSGAEVCATYGAVARLWRDGESRYAARADSARQRWVALRCKAPA
jgi:tetratricopeptide (TPR) repeat protein